MSRLLYIVYLCI